MHTWGRSDLFSCPSPALAMNASRLVSMKTLREESRAVTDCNWNGRHACQQHDAETMTLCARNHWSAPLQS